MLFGLDSQSASAQKASIPSTNPRIQQALNQIKVDNEWTLGQQITMCEIPAPPFKETERGIYFANQLKEMGLKNIRTDGEGNVIGEIHGNSAGPTLVLSGHLDTVFPEETDVRVTRDGSKLAGPGIGDDCRGLAAVLATTRAITKNAVPLAGKLLVVGTVGEEGPGNLRGVRALFSGPLKDSIDYFISVDGTGNGTTNGAVGSARYRYTIRGPGGHSYGAFGLVNPIHAVGRAIASIADMQVPREPRTTFNVGIIDGGTSVNTIANGASFDVDMRSEDEATLQKVDAEVRQRVEAAMAAEQARWPNSRGNLSLHVDTIGIRPAGTNPDTSFIVRTAQAASDSMQIYSPLGRSSTDSNIPISLGVPAITIGGGGVGRSGHALDESYDDREDGYLGPQRILLIVSGILGLSEPARIQP